LKVTSLLVPRFALAVESTMRLTAVNTEEIDKVLFIPFSSEMSDKLQFVEVPSQATN
jgi:hypothetical protein